MYRGMRLRTKFLLSLLAISSGLTAATLFVVSYSVERRVRESLRDELRNSVKIYETFDQQREAALSRVCQAGCQSPNRSCSDDHGGCGNHSRWIRKHLEAFRAARS